jgi:hypothetical protein
MAKLAAICASILVLLLSASTLAGFGFPPNMAIGLTLFGGCVVGLLAMALRLSFEERRRGHHHHD